MKIAFVGNMNNMPLMYARELRELGHDVDFHVDACRHETLHRPEHRYPEYRTYPEWMIDRPVRLPILAYGFPRLLLGGLLRRLEAGNYDGFVLDGLAVGLAADLPGRKFALLAGSDLDVICDPRSLDFAGFVRRFGAASGRLRHFLLSRLFVRQRAGLRACAGFSYFAEGINPRAEELLDDIYAGLAPYRLQVRGTDTGQLDYDPGSDRRGDDAVIFVPVRFLWREPLPAGFSPLENKRNDIIVRGLADYLRRSGRRPAICLVEKGPDVAATKALAAELGIADRLTWLKEMPQSEIFDWYRKADIVFDQLGDHIVGAVGLDSMLVGRPVIANLRPDVFDRLLPEPWPACHASTAAEVADWLERLVDDPGLRREIGRKSHDFVRAYYDKRLTGKALEQFFAGARS